MARAFSAAFLLPIQRMLADANPLGWRDGFVQRVEDDAVTVMFMDGAVQRLRVVGPAAELVAGEPVAYHPVAEVFHCGRFTTTARS